MRLCTSCLSQRPILDRVKFLPADEAYPHWPEPRCGPICRRRPRNPRGESLTDKPDDAWVEVRRFAAQADAEQHALVLAAVGIGCRLVARDSAIALYVALPDAARARGARVLCPREPLEPV